MLRDFVLLLLVCAVAFGGWLLLPLLRARLRGSAPAGAMPERERVAERLAGLGSWVHALRYNRRRWS